MALLKHAPLFEGPRVALVLNPRELDAVVEELGIGSFEQRPRWTAMAGNSGLTWPLEVDDEPVWIVGLSPDLDLADVVSILVHESVHVWQGYCEYISEDKPSREFEAYSIQGIHKELMRQFGESKAGKKRIKAG